jgi:hypothetical protein
VSPDGIVLLDDLMELRAGPHQGVEVTEVEVAADGNAKAKVFKKTFEVNEM